MKYNYNIKKKWFVLYLLIFTSIGANAQWCTKKAETQQKKEATKDYPLYKAYETMILYYDYRCKCERGEVTDAEKWVKSVNAIVKTNEDYHTSIGGKLERVNECNLGKSNKNNSFYIGNHSNCILTFTVNSTNKTYTLNEGEELKLMLPYSSIELSLSKAVSYDNNILDNTLKANKETSNSSFEGNNNILYKMTSGMGVRFFTRSKYRSFSDQSEILLYAESENKNNIYSSKRDYSVTLKTKDKTFVWVSVNGIDKVLDKYTRIINVKGSSYFRPQLYTERGWTVYNLDNYDTSVYERTSSGYEWVNGN